MIIDGHYIEPEAFEFQPEVDEFEGALGEFESGPGGPETSTGVFENTPVPGRFYSIQAGGGGLLKTTGRAYGLKDGAERLRRAQSINNHPLNQKFWRPPENAFERKYFKQGIISFTPRFTCGGEQGLAGRGKKKCFATI